jgi:hypothetical protein
MGGYEVHPTLRPEVTGNYDCNGVTCTNYNGAYWAEGGVQKPGFEPGPNNPWNADLPSGRWRFSKGRDTRIGDPVYFTGDPGQVLDRWNLLPHGERDLSNEISGYMSVWIAESPFGDPLDPEEDIIGVISVTVVQP